MKKAAAEFLQMIWSTYSEVGISEITCRKWFINLTTGILTSRSGIVMPERKVPKVQNWRHFFNDKSCQSREAFDKITSSTSTSYLKLLKALCTTLNQENLVPYELKRRNFEQRLCACKNFLQRREMKLFLHFIVTGHRKVVHYHSSNHKNSLEYPSHAYRWQLNGIFESRKFFSAVGRTTLRIPLRAVET